MKKIYSAAITPITEDDKLDVPSLERMLKRNMAHGLDGYFFLGSMGEWSQWDDDMKEELVEAACGIVGDQAEKLFGITATGTIPMLKLMERFSKHPVDAYVLMLPPFVLNRVDPFDTIMAIVDRSDRPMYLYYIPPVNQMALTTDQFRDLLAHPKIKGLKNSSGCMWQRKELLMLKKEVDFIFLEGEEWCIDEALIMGCDGALAGMASLGSKPMKRIAAAVDAGDYDLAKEIQADLVRVFWGVYGKEKTTVFNGHKYALHKLGLISSPKTLIQNPNDLTEERKRGIEACLEEFRDFLD